MLLLARLWTVGAKVAGAGQGLVAFCGFVAGLGMGTGKALPCPWGLPVCAVMGTDFDLWYGTCSPGKVQCKT